MRLLTCFLAVVLLSCNPKPEKTQPPPKEEPVGASITVSGLDVYFSPHGGCDSKVLEFINAETKEILVQAYSFTNQAIADALIAKGPIVHVLVDRTQTSDKIVHYLMDHNVDVLIDKKHPIAHNKVIVTPGAVETGSYNYTGQAEDNAENCLFIKYKPLATKYRDNWMVHKAHSVTPDLGTGGTSSAKASRDHRRGHHEETQDDE
jgi:phosphatidylserine/phosphatidylglycerophosphate/cardiolipin synthase-like enzyme